MTYNVFGGTCSIQSIQSNWLLWLAYDSSAVAYMY